MGQCSLTASNIDPRGSNCLEHVKHVNCNPPADQVHVRVVQPVLNAPCLTPLQELLAKVPDEVATKMVKSILKVCHDLFPELSSRYEMHLGGDCGKAAAMRSIA